MQNYQAQETKTKMNKNGVRYSEKDEIVRKLFRSFRNVADMNRTGKKS